MLFNDATLQEMAQYMPTSNIEMLQINGVGAIKLERFGQPFMALIREHKAILEKAERISAVKTKNFSTALFLAGTYILFIA